MCVFVGIFQLEYNVHFKNRNFPQKTWSILRKFTTEQGIVHPIRKHIIKYLCNIFKITGVINRLVNVAYKQH